MKKTALLVFAISIILVPGDVYSQNFNKIFKKAVVDPTRKANDIAMDKAEDKAEEEAEEHITNAIMEGFGISEDVEYDQDYQFDSWFSMQLTEYKKNGKVDRQTEYDNYFNREKGNYGMKFMESGTSSTILFDSERNAMIILTDDDGDKSGFATRFDPDKLEEKAENYEVSDDWKPLKTGKTKTILGYLCDEYLMDNEDAEIHMWHSEKLGKEISKEMLSNPNAFGATFQYAHQVEGMMLEYNLIDKKRGSRTEVLVTGIDLKKNNSISTSGYTIISMGMRE